jgi:hypothetical protein
MGIKDKPLDTKANDGMGPYGRPAEKGMPPEPPLWHGHAWQPVNVEFDPSTGRFTDGYQPGPGDKPKF